MMVKTNIHTNTQTLHMSSKHTLYQLIICTVRPSKDFKIFKHNFSALFGAKHRSEMTNLIEMLNDHKDGL